MSRLIRHELVTLLAYFKDVLEVTFLDDVARYRLFANVVSQDNSTSDYWLAFDYTSMGRFKVANQVAG